MKKLFRRTYHRLGQAYLKRLLNQESQHRQQGAINERPVEYAFAFKHLGEKCTGPLLDVGPGLSSWPHLLANCGFDVTASDKVDGYWTDYFNRHFPVVQDDITRSDMEKRFQFITCLSVLEHIADCDMAIREMHRLLLPGGYLMLTFPYNESQYSENIYAHPEAGYGKDAPFITQVFSRAEIDRWVDLTGMRVLEQEYYRCFTGEFWTMGKRVTPSIPSDADSAHHLTCILLQKSN